VLLHILYLRLHLLLLVVVCLLHALLLVPQVLYLLQLRLLLPLLVCLACRHVPASAPVTPRRHHLR
jgi:hypothetical protein